MDVSSKKNFNVKKAGNSLDLVMFSIPHLPLVYFEETCCSAVSQQNTLQFRNASNR